MDCTDDLRGKIELFLVAAFDQVEENLFGVFQGLLVGVVEKFPDIDTECQRQSDEHVQVGFCFPLSMPLINNPWHCTHVFTSVGRNFSSLFSLWVASNY